MVSELLFCKQTSLSVDFHFSFNILYCMIALILLSQIGLSHLFHDKNHRDRWDELLIWAFVCTQCAMVLNVSQWIEKWVYPYVNNINIMRSMSLCFSWISSDLQHVIWTHLEKFLTHGWLFCPSLMNKSHFSARNVSFFHWYSSVDRLFLAFPACDVILRNHTIFCSLFKHSTQISLVW